MRWVLGVFTVLALPLLIPGVFSPLEDASAWNPRDDIRARLAGLPDQPLEALVIAEPGMEEQVRIAMARYGLPHDEQLPLVNGIVTVAYPNVLRALVDIPGVRNVYPSEALSLNLDQSRAAVKATDAARVWGATGANVTVAVVDSGIDASHPGLQGRVRVGLRFGSDGASASDVDTDGHGTHVAGIVAGDGARSSGNRLQGLAPRADLVALDISSSFTTTNAIRAFQWIHDHHAEHDIRVVSNSWGREKEKNHYDADDPVIRASSALVADGLVVIFSAGNRGDGASTLTVEATNPDVITVGATNNAGSIESYSSRGPARDASGRAMAWTKPDIVAPGTHIESARSGQGPQASASGEAQYYVVMNGTSMAAPHVAAAAALLIDRDPSLTPFDVRDLLLGTARGTGAPDMAYGHGLLDVDAALRALATHGGAPGTERVEIKKPLRATGSYGTAGGYVLLNGHMPQVPMEEALKVPLDTHPEARALTFTFKWSSPTTTFRVFLVDDEGTATYGPFLEKGGQKVTATVPNLPPGKRWHLEAHPQGIVSQGTFDVTGEQTLIELHSRPIEGGGVPHRGGLHNPGALGFFEEQARIDALRSLLTPLGLLKVGALLAVGGLLTAFTVRAWRKRRAA